MALQRLFVLQKLFVLFILVFVSAFFLGGCFGASMDISIYSNGSGKIVLEYKVSEMMESLGRLDGNEKWQTIPVGKADFERMVSRIPGLSLKSVAASQQSNTLVTKAELAFDNIEALVVLLNGGANAASFSTENGQNRLRLTLAEPEKQALSGDMLSLLKMISSPYEISCSLSVPKEANLTFNPGDIPFTQLTAKGRKVSFSIGTGEILELKDGLVVDIKW